MIGDWGYRVAYSPIVVSGLVWYSFGWAPSWHCVHVYSRAGKCQRSGGSAGRTDEPMCATDVRGNAPGRHPAMVRAASRQGGGYGAADLSCAIDASYHTTEMTVRRDLNAVAEQPPGSAQPREDTPW